MCACFSRHAVKEELLDKIKDPTVQRSNQEPKEQKDNIDDKEISTWRMMILFEMNGGQCRQNENEQCQEVEEDQAAQFTAYEGGQRELAWRV